MPIDIRSIAALWETEQPMYEQLGKVLVAFMKNKISAIEILPEISYRTKDLLSIIKKIKKKQREKPYDYTSLHDKLGIRIICTFQEDLENIHLLLVENFRITKADLKKDNLDFNKLEYTSNHYDASIDITRKEFKSLDKFQNFCFEIQVRTFNQHAWSNSAHGLSYKQEAELLPQHKRRMYRLLSLYEIADDEFSAVNNQLLRSTDNLIYNMLRKLESKLYKYAQVDFDRDTSMYTLTRLLTFFTEEELKELNDRILPFIIANDAKITQIFEENRVRYHEIPLLTQPEIFLIWFALQKYPFSIDDNWAIHFDEFDLEQIKNLWGKTIE